MSAEKLVCKIAEALHTPAKDKKKRASAEALALSWGYWGELFVFAVLVRFQ